jgi:hypothetical protein
MSLITFEKVNTKSDINPVKEKKLYFTKDSKIVWIQLDGTLIPFPGDTDIESPSDDWTLMIEKIPSIKTLHGEYIKRRLYGEGEFTHSIYADFDNGELVKYGGSDIIPIPDPPISLIELMIEKVQSIDYYFYEYDNYHIYADKGNRCLYVDFKNNKLVKYGGTEVVYENSI